MNKNTKNNEEHTPAALLAAPKPPFFPKSYYAKKVETKIFKMSPLELHTTKARPSQSVHITSTVPPLMTYSGKTKAIELNSIIEFWQRDYQGYRDMAQDDLHIYFFFHLRVTISHRFLYCNKCCLKIKHLLV